MMLVMVGCIAFILAYIYFYAGYVHDAPDRWNRVVGGGELTGIVSDMRVADPNRFSIGRALDEVGGYDAEKVWEKQSLAKYRFVCILLWLGLFTTASFIFALFVVLQMRTTAIQAGTNRT